METNSTVYLVAVEVCNEIDGERSMLIAADQSLLRLTRFKDYVRGRGATVWQSNDAYAAITHPVKMLRNSELRGKLNGDNVALTGRYRVLRVKLDNSSGFSSVTSAVQVYHGLENGIKPQHEFETFCWCHVR